MAANDASKVTDRGHVRERAAEYLLNRHRFRATEALPWLIAIAVYFIFPDRLTFGSQVLVMVMFALSLDLILGYAGIVTLGHAAFFGIGAYTVGLAAARLQWTRTWRPKRDLLPRSRQRHIDRLYCIAFAGRLREHTLLRQNAE